MLFPSAATILDGKEESGQEEQSKALLGGENFSSFKQPITLSPAPPESQTSNTEDMYENRRSKRKLPEKRETSSDSSSCWSSGENMRELTKRRKEKKTRRKQDDFGESNSEDDNENRRSKRKSPKRREFCSDFSDSSREMTKRRKKKKTDRKQDSDSDSSEELELKKHKDHKKKKKKSKKKKKKQKDSKTNEQERPSKPDTIWLDETSLDATQAFRKDNRPDRHNYNYGSLYKMDIASFFKPVKIKCLGLSKHQAVCLYPRKQKKQKKSDVSSSNFRYFLKPGSVPEILSDENEAEIFVHALESETFIPLKKNIQDTTGVETLGKNRTEFRDDYYSQQNRIFSQKLLDNPQDVRTWIQFVDAQNELRPAWSHGGDLQHNKEQWLTSKVLREKKVSILEKSLLKNPSSIDLMLRHMRLVKDLWPPADVKEKWKKLLFQFPNRSTMWLDYLTFVQTELIGMNLTSVLDAYRKCFRMLLGIHYGTMKSHQPEVNAVDGLLMVFVHLLLFFWQAGQTEKATTLLQCFLEFNLSKSHASLTADYAKKLKMFEDYFDSETPRLGEEGYQSWDEYTTNRKSQSQLSSTHKTLTTEQSRFPRITESPVQITGVSFDHILSEAKQQQQQQQQQQQLLDFLPKEKIWVQLETVRSGNDILGYHGNPDECEDTERIVLFDDISFALFAVTNQERLFQLLMIYLLLFGVPVPKSRLNKNLYEVVSKYALLIKSCSKQSNNRCFCRNFMFCDYVVISTDFHTTSCLVNEVVLATVRRLLSQLIPSFDSAHAQLLSQIWFHFESILFRRSFEDLENDAFSKKYWKEMRKFIKALLKLPPNRSCVVLWDMYATYEWNLGNVEDSQKIFSTAIQLEQGSHHGDKETCSLLIAGTVRYIIDLFLEKSEDILKAKNQLLNIFLAFLEPSKAELQFSALSPPSSLKLLKVSTLMKNEYSRLLNVKLEQWTRDSIDFVCCHAVFMFVFAGPIALNNIAGELLSYFKSSSACESELGCLNGFKTTKIRDLDYSDILKYILVIMKGYVERNREHFLHYKSVLERSVKLSPNDDVINGFYVHVKKHGMNSLEVRRMFESSINTHVLQEHNLVPWLHYLKYEEQRLLSISLIPAQEKCDFQIVDSKTGVHNRIRSLYQKILREESFRCNSHVWCMYLQFQLKHFGTKQAKDVLYTALRNCPSSKALYTLGCEKLDNFQELYDMMTEKEVRVRLLMEELDLLLMD